VLDTAGEDLTLIFVARFGSYLRRGTVKKKTGGQSWVRIGTPRLSLSSFKENLERPTRRRRRRVDYLSRTSGGQREAV